MAVIPADLDEAMAYVRQCRAFARDLADRAERSDRVVFTRGSALGYANTLDEMASRAEALVRALREATR